MINFLKKLSAKLFAEQKPALVELLPKDMKQWLNEQATRLNSSSFILEYFRQIEELNFQMEEKASQLKEAEMSKEHRNVQERIKNIVIGHKDHYAAEIERFAQNLASKILPKEKFPTIRFSTISDYEEALLFNEKLNGELDLLAKRTAKSYQAAQHLFFEPVEELFKLLRELNREVKRFNEYAAENKIAELKNIDGMINLLNGELGKKERLEEELKLKKEELAAEENKKRKNEEKLKKLTESSEYQEYLKLKEKLSRLEQQFKDIEYKTFSFFSKLDKALKKYEKIALESGESKLVKEYLSNSTEAFWRDSELKIISTLNSIKKNLRSLQFDDKQKKKFLELTELSESGYLQNLAADGKNIMKEKEVISKNIHENKTADDIEETKKEILGSENKIETIKEEISATENHLEKINLEKTKEQLAEKIKEVLKIEIKIK
ncbi:MAG: hypothetical protein AB1668_00290 [Nanoarchaeota archaeon]